MDFFKVVSVGEGKDMIWENFKDYEFETEESIF